MLWLCWITHTIFCCSLNIIVYLCLSLLNKIYSTLIKNCGLHHSTFINLNNYWFYLFFTSSISVVITEADQGLHKRFNYDFKKRLSNDCPKIHKISLNKKAFFFFISPNVEGFDIVQPAALYDPLVWRGLTDTEIQVSERNCGMLKSRRPD